VTDRPCNLDGIQHSRSVTPHRQLPALSINSGTVVTTPGFLFNIQSFEFLVD